ncbi:hypothetical protein Ciccas_011638 [Cichlidogyrus casuarinus]|uniref:Uncharacterized protein n=1 Tax=Cichlidogyrus casuarinus TaxID=1844966 RepID=A0ABD2PQN4_9PLAT
MSTLSEHQHEANALNKQNASSDNSLLQKFVDLIGSWLKPTQQNEHQLIFIIATGLLGFGLLIVMLKFSLKKKKRPVPIEEQTSIIVDIKEGIRELNPKYKLRFPSYMTEEYKPEMFKQDFCVSLMNNLKENPDRELFGWHEEAEAPFKWMTMKQVHLCPHP